MAQKRLNYDEFIKLLKEYDFKNYSISSFSKKYGVCTKTVKKYILKFNLPYNSKKRSIELIKNPLNGQFISSFFVSKKEDQIKKLEKKYEKVFNPNNKVTNIQNKETNIQNKKTNNNYFKLPNETQKEFTIRMEKLING